MKKVTAILFFCTILAFTSAEIAAQQPARPHVVFVFGDEEYRSEESMPMIARILKRELNAKVTLCYPVDQQGLVNPNTTDNIQGLEALQTADLMVVFCRWRNLPQQQAKYITDYAESGRPMVGFRTSTHTFMYKDAPEMAYLINDWPANVFGQQWITHHGHFDDGKNPLTAVSVTDAASPILNGFKPFQAYSWLYHVNGGNWKLRGNPHVLLAGTSLKSQHQIDGRLEQYPLTNPVAWTKTYTGATGKTGRVFFTTLGHPYDFQEESMRKLTLNGIYWALGKENMIPENGVNVDFSGIYKPNNSGFGSRFKPNLKPEQLD